MLDNLSTEYSNSGLSTCLSDMAEYLRTGDTLTARVQKHPQYFSIMATELIHAAEVHGDLSRTMERIGKSINFGAFLPVELR